MGPLAGNGSGACGFSVCIGDGDVMASRVNFTAGVINELIDAMLYLPRDPMETAGEIYSRWWSNHRRDYQHIGSKQCRSEFMKFARSVYAEFAKDSKPRCPRCGAKILTLRCRACDLLEEMERERRAAS